MPGLGDIVGQPAAVENLRAALRASKVHHAYLFEGPEGVGKRTTARALAVALNCETRRLDGDGCGQCGACHKIAADLHPDLIAFDMTPKGLTERVRDLLGTLAFRPHEGRARVVVLDPAEGLAAGRAEAANVLLKTLEEPPADTHFVLVSSEAQRLPVTVRSRCQRVRFRPLEEAAIVRWLIAQRGLAPDAAETAAQLSGASLGRAVEAIGDEGAARSEALAALFAAAHKNSARALFDAAADLGGDRDEAAALCALLWRGLRDALLVREGLATGRVSAARAAGAAELAGARSTAELLGLLHATEQTIEALRGNVAPALALEQLLFRLAPPAPAPARRP
jgi:DNA polymerase-3 subunit delta'